MPLNTSTILSDDRQFFNELLEILMVVEMQRWDLYADISIFCERSRISYLERIRKEIEEGTVSASRLFVSRCSFMPLNIISTVVDPDAFVYTILNRAGCIYEQPIGPAMEAARLTSLEDFLRDHIRRSLFCENKSIVEGLGGYEKNTSC